MLDAGRRAGGAGAEGRGHGAEDRDGARAGVDVARRPARSEQDLSPPRAGRPREAGAEVHLEDVPEGAGRSRASRRSTWPSPDFFAALNKLLTTTPMADWKALPALAPRARRGAGAVEGVRRRELRASTARRCRATAELEPRWKRCVKATDRAMGEALGAGVRARRRSAPRARTRTQTMVREIEAAMNDEPRHARVDGRRDAQAGAREAGSDRQQDRLPRQVAQLRRARRRAASRTWRTRCAPSEFETKRAAGQDRQAASIAPSGSMTPPTVNAYYDPPMNEMVFPAGILQPPFFNQRGGAAGQLRRHRHGHGPRADPRLRRRGAPVRRQGQPARLVDAARWARSSTRAPQCVVKQFDGYVAVDDLHVNGKLTLGENIADLGGMKLAHARVLNGGAARRSRRRSASWHRRAAVLPRLRAVRGAPSGGRRWRACA